MRVVIGAVFRQADAVAQRETPSIPSVNTDEGAGVPGEGDHLLEDRVEHELPQGDLPVLRELHQRAANVECNRDDFRVADVGRQGRLNVVSADNQYSPLGIRADQHATVESGRGGQVAQRKRVADLMLDNIFERRAAAAPKVG
jgi:hypothetical protein